MLASKSGFSVLCAHFNGFLHIFKNEIFKLTVLAETRCVVCWEHNDVTNFTMYVSGNHRFFEGKKQQNSKFKRNEIICSNVCHNAALWCVRPSNVISPDHHWPIAKLVTVDDLASSIEKKNIQSRISNWGFCHYKYAGFQILTVLILAGSDEQYDFSNHKAIQALTKHELCVAWLRYAVVGQTGIWGLITGMTGKKPRRNYTSKCFGWLGLIRE